MEMFDLFIPRHPRVVLRAFISRTAMNPNSSDFSVGNVITVFQKYFE